VIDQTSTDFRPLSYWARKIPNRRGGVGINVATTWRWAMAGVRGIRLKTVMVGGIRMTNGVLVSEFFAALTAAADRAPAPIRSSRQREQAIAAAERELAAE
jgi:hypothetical protein